MSAYRRDFDETKYMKDDQLLEKYNEIWEKLKIVPKKNLIVNLCNKIPKKVLNVFVYQ